METSHEKNGITQPRVARAVEETLEGAELDVRERIERARDVLEDLRDRAELAFHERPYLLPVATGAVGLGVGILIGSKLSRIVALTAAGALLSDTLRTQMVKISREFIKAMNENVEDDDREELEPNA